VQPHLTDLGELDAPVDELSIALDPAAPIEGVIAFVL
jgi:hypothetical protein